MGVSFDDAVAILLIRQANDSLLKRHMIGVRDRYNGDWVIPMTELPDEPTITPPVPALIADAIDSTAMRACSTRPSIHVPAVNPASNPSRDRANKRQRAYYATWHESKLQLKLRRSTRHLVGYGTNVMGVVPGFSPDGKKANDRAIIECRDPLTAYPDESAPEEVRMPTNIGFIYPRSPSWIVSIYPEARDYIQNHSSELWDMFEWVDDEHVYIGILGPRQTWGDTGPNSFNYANGVILSNRGPLMLRQWVNRAGCVPFVCPGRVTLDRIAGQVTKMVGVVDMYGQLMALEAIAAEKAVFADKYIIGRANEDVSLVSGATWHDGRSGEINLIKGGEKVGELMSQLNPQTFQVADRLSEAIRMSTGNPGVFGGSMQGNIRSGQTITQLGNYAIDPRVQEIQEIIEYQLSTLNEGIHEVIKGYWPNQKFTYFSGWASDRGFVEFKPNTDFENPANVVAYGMTGADISQLTVAVGQALQMKLMDRHTAMVVHPLIENPDLTEKAVIEEALTDTGLAAFLAQAQQGSLAMVDLANVIKHYRATGDFIESVIRAQKDAQERQATEAPPAAPGQVAAPQTMPGLESPGASGVEMPPSAGGGGPGGMAALLQALGSQSGAGAPVGPGVL